MRRSQLIWIVGILCIMVLSLGTIAFNIEPSEPIFYTYDLEVHKTEYTHVKLSVVHRAPGVKDQDFSFKIQPIPENGVIEYTVDYRIKHMFVYMEFYNESGSGYRKMETESYSLEF